ncbi:MAG: DUF3137 domain-containing protein [Pseudomonadota bacterium]
MSSYAFTETAPYEQGFGKVFQSRIVPILEDHEQRRKEYRKKAMTWMGSSGVVGVGGIGGGVNYDSMLGLIAGGFGATGAFIAKAYFEKQWQQGLGGEILPILCGFLGGMEYGDRRISLSDFVRVGIVPNHNVSTLEDQVTGEHDGLGWSMIEATLKNRTKTSKGTRTSTVFRGLLFEIQIHGPAPRIFFGKDRGGLLNWSSELLSGSRRGLEKIDVGDAEFRSIYETYTSDPHAARAYIDDRLTSGLMEVARSEAGKSFIACAMEGDSLYLALPRRGDFLGLGSLFKPLTSVERDLHEALADLTMPGRVIDHLRGM